MSQPCYSVSILSASSCLFLVERWSRRLPVVVATAIVSPSHHPVSYRGGHDKRRGANMGPRAVGELPTRDIKAPSHLPHKVRAHLYTVCQRPHNKLLGACYRLATACCMAHRRRWTLASPRRLWANMSPNAPRSNAMPWLSYPAHPAYHNPHPSLDYITP